MSQHGPRAGDDLKELVERPLSFGQTVKAVAWAFLGVRKHSAYQQDIHKLNPVYLIVTGLIAAILFIVSLWLVVKWVVASASGA